MEQKELDKLANDFIDSHNLQKVELPELKFTTITGAINAFTECSAGQKLTMEEVKTLLVKILTRYRYSDDVKDIFEFKKSQSSDSKFLESLNKSNLKTY